MERSCDSCGATFDAKRSTKKTCSDTCRKRLQRPSKPRLTVVEDLADADPLVDPRDVALVTPAVLRELQKVHAEDSAAGRVALALSVRLDNGHGDTGSALASVARQLLEAMKTATAEAKAPPASPLEAMRNGGHYTRGRTGA